MVAAGILIAGAVPAAADPVALWLEKNRDQLPRSYAEISALPASYRRAVYSELTPLERSVAWVTQLTYYKATGPPLSQEQSEVFERALALAGDPGGFADDHVPSDSTNALATRAITAFGIDRARDIFATLGPGESPTAPEATCGCSTYSDYCRSRCRAGGCTPTSPGCGFLYQYTCNGRCA